MKDTAIVGYEGCCPVCGSSDGMIMKCQDGKYRNICRFLNCRCFYIPAPAVGFDTKEDCENPFESDYLKGGTVTVGGIYRKEVKGMNPPATWAVLLPIRKQHAANIYAGTKAVELRKTVPRLAGSYMEYPFRVYLYESKADGGAGAVTGFFTCPACVGVCKQDQEEKYPQSFAKRAQVTPEYVENYGGGGWLYSWEVKEPTRLPEPVALSALGIDRAPQSWRYLGTDACKVLEVAARGSPAE